MLYNFTKTKDYFVIGKKSHPHNTFFTNTLFLITIK